jgi:hypothetical protein
MTSSSATANQDLMNTHSDRKKRRAMKLKALQAEIQKGANSGKTIPAQKVFAAVRARIAQVATPSMIEDQNCPGEGAQ